MCSKSEGATISCATRNPHCGKRFHVMCARKSDTLEMEQSADRVLCVGYCVAHKKQRVIPETKQTEDVMESEQTEDAMEPEEPRISKEKEKPKRMHKDKRRELEELERLEARVQRANNELELTRAVVERFCSQFGIPPPSQSMGHPSQQ